MQIFFVTKYHRFGRRFFTCHSGTWRVLPPDFSFFVTNRHETWSNFFSLMGQRKFTISVRDSQKDQKFFVSFCHVIGSFLSQVVMALKVLFPCSLWGVLCDRLSWDRKVFPLLVKGKVIICGWLPRNSHSLSCILVIVVHTERLHEEVRHRVEQMEHHPERPQQFSHQFSYKLLLFTQI